jgi:hypothetical protein
MDYRLTKALIKYVYCLFILLPGLSTGCAVKDEILKADLGEQFSLHMGQTAQIEAEQLAIRFNGVSGDSRCPRGVECFWEGEVNCDVVVTYKGESSNITLTQSGAEQSSEATYREYRLIYSVEPYPQAGKQIATADYRLILTVEKLRKGLPTIE